MHGLINRAIQCFVTDSYGADKWVEATRFADLDFVEFEAMLLYDDDITPKLLDAISNILNRPRSDVMEDMGTYLVSHPNVEALRRLLRFGGVTFVEFLHSLDDLPDRARLAVSDLNLPRIELRDHSPTHFSLICESPINGCGHVMMGILRTMADDYGALALLEHTGSGDGIETISVTLVETEFAAGRAFDLGARAQ
ncbi:heme NO-binding domain-containing protein [Tateyamaria omphalii]|uniref:heme NO-binding domain-containing protein n=1 Tax=Tateyamaria omphalii TaxID=299262 RepID=UPI001C9946A6|nr:heme NO-binding domain-containing protein [Tateyamaria omphalii]MBY5932034.1 heme NO-binding domain-containing protein [Tateyamaria omphalii]